jgi:DNA-binding MarR family transcriptional regulator
VYTHPSAGGVKELVGSRVIVKVLVNQPKFDKSLVSGRCGVCEIPSRDLRSFVGTRTRVRHASSSSSSIRPVLTSALSVAAEDTARTPSQQNIDSAAFMTTSRRPRNPRQPLFREFHVDATAFLYEIIRVADCLREARAFDGEPALYLGSRWQLLRAIERCGGAPTFSDLGRSLRISRQAAREQALKVSQAGLVELFSAPDDRRAVQVALTPAGRREIERQRMPTFASLFTLLNGLEPSAMRSTNHVLHVMRQRLERYQREMRCAAR